jgi:hypothetical protein
MSCIRMRSLLSWPISSIIDCSSKNFVLKGPVPSYFVGIYFIHGGVLFHISGQWIINPEFRLGRFITLVASELLILSLDLVDLLHWVTIVSPMINVSLSH